MINTQWLKLSMSRTNFHGPKAVQAIEVQLNANEENVLSDCKDTTAADDILIFIFFSEKIRLAISDETSIKQMIHMKSKYFLWKINIKKNWMSSTSISHSAARVKMTGLPSYHHNARSEKHFNLFRLIKLLSHYILEKSNCNFKYVRLCDLGMLREKLLNF